MGFYENRNFGQKTENFSELMLLIGLNPGILQLTMNNLKILMTFEYTIKNF